MTRMNYQLHLKKVYLHVISMFYYHRAPIRNIYPWAKKMNLFFRRTRLAKKLDSPHIIYGGRGLTICRGPIDP